MGMLLDLQYCKGLEGGFDSVLPKAVHMIVLAIQIVVPIILIVFGLMDLAKAVMSNDEKTMKESQGKFIKRIVYAIIVFFVVAIVQLIFNLLGNIGATDSSGDKNSNCLSCFINGECSSTPQ